LRPRNLRRFDVYDRVWGALADAPVTGTGFGTFPDAFRWHQGAVGGFFDYAHNTYLEAAMELGAPVACALLAAVAGAVGLCIQGLRARRHHRLYPALAVSAAALLGSHALFDFSVQIPAVAITFAALLGMGCAQSFRQVRRAARPRQGSSEAVHG
jgi:O-antigen ligase